MEAVAGGLLRESTRSRRDRPIAWDAAPFVVDVPFVSFKRQSGATGVSGAGDGTYTITFNQDVSACAYLATAEHGDND